MADELKQTIEDYIATALKSRIEEGARTVGDVREQIINVLGDLETKIQEAGGREVTLPEDLLPQPAEPQADSGLLSHVLSSQNEMLAASDQIGLLTQLLLASTVSCPRVAFFIVKKDAIVGWAARGFEGLKDADVRGVSIGVDEDTILSTAFRTGEATRGGPGQFGGDEQFLEKLGGGSSAESMAVPIFIRDKIVALLYGDSGADERIAEPELPEILAMHAGLCLETLATRQKYPRKKTGEPVGDDSGSIQARSQAAPPPSASLSGVFTKPTSAQPVAPEPRPQAAPAPEPAPARAPAAPSPSQAAEVPAPAAPRAATPPAPALDQLSDEERKAHEEARRFARLLVSEIVLYNEKQAEEGRRSKNIYERLKDDIDRSLQMYEARVGADVRSNSNYFYEELVRTLANGDESALKVPWA